MHAVLLPVAACTFLVVCLWPLLSKWISPRYVMLFFSLACLVLISWASTVVLLVFSVLIFFGGKILHRDKTRITLYAIVATCLAPLILYKIIDAKVCQQCLIDPQLLTFEIIGISYFTFNGLSYLFDIRKGYLVPEMNYAHLLLFLCYFPCIAAGPLHRYKYLDAQFSQALKPDNENFSRGFRLILWGLFKNLVLAQRLKLIVDLILDNPEGYQGIFVLLGGLAFFFQLYCDFSAYVDVAMGFSRMMGIQISANFSNRVYLSSSRSDFWKGWHQTLNNWFRDYLFFPLVKGQTNRSRINLALLITFILIGLWHEVSYKFLIWGLLNGIWILAETKIRPRLAMLRGRMWEAVGVLYHLSMASFMAIIFRTTDLYATSEALLSANREQFSADSIWRKIIFIVPLFIFTDMVNKAMKEDTIDIYLGRKKRWQRWAFYFSLGLTIMAFGILPDESHYYIRF